MEEEEGRRQAAAAAVFMICVRGGGLMNVMMGWVLGIHLTNGGVISDVKASALGCLPLALSTNVLYTFSFVLFFSLRSCATHKHQYATTIP